MKNIEVSFTVPVALEQTDVHWLEATLLKLREQVFLTVLERVIAVVEARALRQAGSCPSCSGPCVQNGREPRQLPTLLGRVRFQRSRVRCQRCGRERFPLDDALGVMPRLRQTLGVRERALWAATEVSYAKSAAFLAKFTGLAVSQHTIHTMVQEEGGLLLAHDAVARQAVFEQGEAPPSPTRQPRVLFIQVDGTGVRHRAPQSSMESKVGVIFSDRAQVSANRVELLDKRVVASLEPAAACGEALWLEAQRHGVEQAEQVVLISDGASWIKEVHALHFPQALLVLDLWHLEQALRRTLGAEHPAIPALLALARAGQAEALLERVQALRTQPASLEALAQLDSLLGYMAANAEGIRNLPRAPIWGSGAVEKQGDVVVCRRLKTRGMSWYRRGPLRCNASGSSNSTEIGSHTGTRADMNSAEWQLSHHGKNDASSPCRPEKRPIGYCLDCYTSSRTVRCQGNQGFSSRRARPEARADQPRELPWAHYQRGEPAGLRLDMGACVVGPGSL